MGDLQEGGLQDTRVVTSLGEVQMKIMRTNRNKRSVE
jgi:hypothetical protein